MEAARRGLPEAPRRLLIIDDHRIVLEAISAYLEDHGAFAVTLARDHGAGLRMLAESAPFDVVLLDIVMPGMNGLVGVSEVIAAAAPTPVVIFSGNVKEDFIARALELGARGYVPKSFPLRSLSTALDLVAGGERFLPADFLVNPAASAQPGTVALTPREARVLRLISEGNTNKQIAWEMDCSEATVKMHVRGACEKLGANNRAHAVVRAKELNLL